MRTDGDVIVLPPSFLDELHSLPKTVANPTDGNMHNLLGNYTGLNILLHTDLHFRVIRGRLTPNLTPTMLAIQDELCYSMRIDYPECRNQWSPIGVYDTILHTVARTSARSFVGAAFCRDVRWLEIVTQFTENCEYSQPIPSFSYHLQTLPCKLSSARSCTNSLGQSSVPRSRINALISEVVPRTCRKDVAVLLERESIC